MRSTLRYLPFSPQSMNISPYLDHSIFQFDESEVSMLARVSLIGDRPLRFYCRKNGSIKFKLPVNGIPGPHSPPASSSTSLSSLSREGGQNTGGNHQHHHLSFGKTPVTIIFHPYLPFVITVRYGYSQNEVPMLNFHVRS